MIVMVWWMKLILIMGDHAPPISPAFVLQGCINVKRALWPVWKWLSPLMSGVTLWIMTVMGRWTSMTLSWAQSVRPMHPGYALWASLRVMLISAGRVGLCFNPPQRHAMVRTTTVMAVSMSSIRNSSSSALLGYRASVNREFTPVGTVYYTVIE